MNTRFAHLTKIQTTRRDWYLSKQDSSEEEEEVEPTEEETGDGNEEVVELSYEIPEDLTDEDFDADAALAVAREVFIDRRDDEAAPATLEELASIVQDIEALSAEVDRRAELAAERQAEVDKMSEKLGLDPKKTDEKPDDENEKLDSDNENEDENEDDKTNDDEDDEKTRVASGTRTFKTTKRPKAPTAPQGDKHVVSDDSGAAPGSWTMVAAAASGTYRDDAGIIPIVDGQTLTMAGVGERMKEHWEQRDVHGTGRKTAVQFQLNADPEHTLSATDDDHNRYVESKFDEHVPAPTVDDFVTDGDGALVASANCGICEHDYSLYDDSDAGKLFMLPTRVLPRGCLQQWEPTTTLCDIIDALRENVACNTETEKTEVELECPQPMDPCDICARYLIIKYDNFRDRSAADTYAREASLHLRAHQINKHLDNLFTVINHPTTVFEDCTGQIDQYPLGSDFFLMLSVQAQALRNEYCISSTYALDITLPCWMEDYIKALCGRMHGCDAAMISSAQVQQMFAAYGGWRVQFVDWWQRLPGDTKEYPNWVDALMMPANSFFEGTQGTLNLGNEIRDSVNNKSNCYTSFTEDFYKACRRKYGARLRRLPLCLNGAMPERVVVPCSVTPGIPGNERELFALAAG